MATDEKNTFLGNFMATATSRIDRMQKLVDQAGLPDGKAVAMEAHLIWGEAAILNLPEVARLARVAEAAARRLASEGSAEAHRAVTSALQSVRQGLAGLDAGRGQAESTNTTLHQCRILVVDDSRFAANALARSFESNGFKVRSASQLADALAICASFEPTVLVTDVFMPNLDVTELCKQFRQATAGRRTAILLVSAHSESELLDSLRTTGADDFVPKSAGTGAVVRRVESLARELSS
jgi:PleD family two-component response regulator